MTIADALIACGWKPWEGGDCPVEQHSYPQVLCADGSTDCESAGDFDWHGSDKYPGDRIIAYRMPE